MQTGRGQKGVCLGIRVMRTKGERVPGREVVPLRVPREATGTFRNTWARRRWLGQLSGVHRHRNPEGSSQARQSLPRRQVSGEVQYRRGFYGNSSGSSPSVPFYSASRISVEQCVRLSFPHSFSLRKH